MKKSSIFGTSDKRQVNPNWFTNKTWMKVLSNRIKSKDQDIYHVHFEKGRFDRVASSVPAIGVLHLLWEIWKGMKASRVR